jgi:DNA-binding CsgD family transcriptional regulator
MIESGLSTLLLELYSCPTDCTRWLTLLDRIRGVLRVRCAAIQLLVNNDDRITVKWAVRDSESEANRDHHDPFISGNENPRLRYRSPFHPRTSEIFLRDKDYAWPGNHEFVRLREGLADLGLGSHLATSVSLSPNERLVLVLHRDVNDRGDYSQDDEGLLAAVMPHLRQAATLTGHLECLRHHNNYLRQTIDRMSFGLVLCDAQSRSSWANHMAKEIFAKHEGLWLTRGQLTGSSRADTESLRSSIAQVACEEADATGSTERCLSLSRSMNGQALQIMVVPLADVPANDLPGGHFPLGRQVLLLFSRQWDSQILSASVVATLFSLSPAESRLTVALCQGQTVNDYAAASGVSVGTARFQLKQVLAKTKAPRQSELVRRICTSIFTHAKRADA